MGGGEGQAGGGGEGEGDEDGSDEIDIAAKGRRRARIIRKVERAVQRGKVRIQPSLVELHRLLY